jgi:hypothetical protein
MVFSKSNTLDGPMSPAEVYPRIGSLFDLPMKDKIATYRWCSNKHNQEMQAEH